MKGFYFRAYTFRGKKTVVLIDGRPVNIEGSDLSSIEFMSNPPARFDATGGAVM